ncbi:hypothetical protein [Aliarcobacter butzleri]|uniref:hypothetical protein n=1 Tax=Aliarcobacter butzleri TaxID=28197 RepID=UPI0021B297D0|nr:hypothetical protein [Aliarcobacter butzleri]MCT7618539.1 hypothetical protein [Aliarcobacter butzleri]
MPAENTYRKDLKKEKMLADMILDEFYSIHLKDFQYERINDFERQYSGIDLIITDKNDNKYYIDEKAQLSYLNFTLPTFAFELSYYKDNNKNEGWLFDEKKVTNKYFLINGIKTEKNNINRYIDCKIYSVDRMKLINYLNKNGFTKENIYKIENEARFFLEQNTINNIENERFDIQFNKKIKLTITNNLEEKPANLVINLDLIVDEELGKLIKDFKK